MIIFDKEKTRFVHLKTLRNDGGSWVVAMPAGMARIVPRDEDGKLWVEYEETEDGFRVRVLRKDRLMELLAQEEVKL